MKIKRCLFIVIITMILMSFTKDSPIVNCKCKGIPLYGRVKVVKYQADFNVRIVERMADLNVRKVKSLPLSCGEWQFIETGHPDFTIRIVDFHPDFTIRFVDYHPGVN